MIYLDNAATSWPKPPSVLEAMTRFLEEDAGSPNRSGHRMAAAAERIVMDVRIKLAKLFGVKDPLRLVFALNCTDALNMAIKGVGLNINTLPVQSVGVGIGVDYAIYIVDRIRQEVADTADIDEAVRRAVRTTGMAVTFTATTVVGGIFLWMFSNLRFQAEMAQLLVFLMILNMFGAITVVPTFYSILRPKVASALLDDDQQQRMRVALARRRLEVLKARRRADDP